MPTTLPPTVHERLARCGEYVYVDGLVRGAKVVLSIDGKNYTHRATGSSHNFLVLPLRAGAVVKAMQDTGAGFSPWSPEVIVEDALVPPQSTPVLPEEIGLCSQCVHVTHLIPGCQVELRIGRDVVGKGTANNQGEICVGVDLRKQRKQKGERGPYLKARMIVCGAPGPDAVKPLLKEPKLPKPVVGSPLFGCQSVVPLTNVHRGARCHLETDTGTALGYICSCWTAVNVFVVKQLVVGEHVRAQCYWDAKPCDDKGPWSDWQLVVPPDKQGIKPDVIEALIEGDQIIRVDNQIVGATLIIKIRLSETQPAEEFGPRPASEAREIALYAPLRAGNVVSVEQTLCGVSSESDLVTVQPRPPEVHAPVIVPPLYECGRVVQVSNLHPGALVRVYQNSVPIGIAWAGVESSISVPVSPTLIAGGKVTARQWVGGVKSDESAPPVAVQSARSVLSPRILQPVAFGDMRVWLSSVMPGSHLVIRSGGAIIGEADASEPIVRVPVSPITGPINVTAQLCDRTKSGEEVKPIVSPCAPGSRFSKVGEEVRSYGKWTITDTPDGENFEMPIEGQLYYPSTNGGKFHPDATNLPLVVIAHGCYPWDYESYKGYDYLAKHLVQWGMLVFSLNMDVVNEIGCANGKTHQYSRAEIILKAIDWILADLKLEGRVNRSLIGLIGHSMGGEGVVVAQFLNESEGRGYSIRGVVSIAPTHWRPEVILRKTKYMQLFGSLDILTVGGHMTGSDANAHYSGFRIYDRAWRPKTHFWIYGARHNPFNRAWVSSEPDDDSALPPQDHERIAKCLINAFFQDALLNQSVYAGYMEGTILPQGLSDLEIHTQHSKGPRTVLDNFGDVDEEIPLYLEALNKNENSQKQKVNTSGTGLSQWDDVDHTAIALAHSPHNTKGVQLGWNSPNATYLSNTSGISKSLTDVFALRVGQFYQDNMRNPVAMPADLFISLSDGTNEATVRLGAVAQVPYPDSTANVLCPMRTVRLPLDAFKAANPVLSLNNIKSVTLRLMGRATGNILVDDLEFSS